VNVIEHAGRWNHNIYYQDVLLHAVPANSRSALDVGCGEGTLTRELARRVPTVVGIDVDRPSIDEARRQVGAAGVEYLLGDFLSYPFEPESFDFIASVATLHHMDATKALTRMRALLSPGGAMAVLGLARRWRSPKAGQLRCSTVSGCAWSRCGSSTPMSSCRC